MLLAIFHWLFDQCRNPGLSDHFKHPLDDALDAPAATTQLSLWS